MSLGTVSWGGREASVSVAERLTVRPLESWRLSAMAY